MVLCKKILCFGVKNTVYSVTEAITYPLGLIDRHSTYTILSLKKEK